MLGTENVYSPRPSPTAFPSSTSSVLLLSPPCVLITGSLSSSPANATISGAMALEETKKKKETDRRVHACSRESIKITQYSN